MTKAVFYGSSTTEGAGASSPDKRFSTIVSRALGWEEINLGIGGTRVVGRDEDGQVIDENSGLARVPFVLDAEPNLVLILYGANDFNQSKLLGDSTHFQQGTFFWDYDTMLRGLLDGLEPDQIVLSTLQYNAPQPMPPGASLAEYNAVISEMGRRYDLRVLDAFTGSGIDARNFASLSSDDIHLNDDGYQRLAAFFIDALQTS